MLSSLVSQIQLKDTAISSSTNFIPDIIQQESKINLQIEKGFDQY